FANQEHCGGQLPVHICVHVPLAIFSAFYASYVANQIHLFTIDYSSDKPIALVVSVNIVGLSQAQSQTVNATPNVQTVIIVPPLISQNFRKFTAEHNTSLHVQFSDTGKRLYYLNDIHLLLHSRWLMLSVVAYLFYSAVW